MSIPTIPHSTLVLDRSTIAALLDLDDCIVAVEEAFRAHANGATLAPGLLHIDAPEGEFHIKAGGLMSPKPYFGLKANAGFFGNARRFGLPNIQGLILLFSADTGYPLAVMDSAGITMQRTGAATAVAAKYLARPNSSIVTICGCGRQGHVQLRALNRVLRIDRVNAFSIDEEEAALFATEMQRELGLEVRQARDLASAVAECDVCVTCTPARSAFVRREFVSRGTFLAAVGADSPDKQEIDPLLLAENTVVVDLLDQCASVGELHHAIEAGLMTTDDVLGELGDVITGRIRARRSDDEIVIFDSTGTALQDVGAAIVVFERALSAGKGTPVDFASTP